MEPGEAAGEVVAGNAVVVCLDLFFKKMEKERKRMRGKETRKTS
jgi:hypothetical protein